MAAGDGIGVGIVGYGLAGRTFHAPFIATVDGLRVAAIATSDAGRQAQARAEHPGAAVLAGRRCAARSAGRRARGRRIPQSIARPDRDSSLGGRSPRRRRQARRDGRAGGRGTRRQRRHGRPAADGVPEPSLGRRLPDRSIADRGRATRVGRQPRGPLRALERRRRRVARGGGAGRRSASRPRRAPRRSKPAAVRAGQPGLRRDRSAPGGHGGRGFGLPCHRSRERRPFADLDVADRRPCRAAHAGSRDCR